jgi:hypothetical protein
LPGALVLFLHQLFWFYLPFEEPRETNPDLKSAKFFRPGSWMQPALNGCEPISFGPLACNQLSRLNHAKGMTDLRLRVDLAALFGELLRLRFHPLLQRLFVGDFHLAAGCGLFMRRGKVFASRMSFPAFRISPANGSRASFCRISSFVSLADSAYAVAGFLRNCVLSCRIADLRRFRLVVPDRETLLLMA